MGHYILILKKLKMLIDRIIQPEKYNDDTIVIHREDGKATVYYSNNRIYKDEHELALKIKKDKLK